jgi:hypothetical protein
MFFDVHLPHAERCIAIGAEVDRIVGVHDQAHPSKDEGPDYDFHNMQIEHEENRPSELERSRDHTGPAGAQTSFAVPLLEEDPVETGSVEKGEKNQDECTNAERRQRLEFVGNPSQEGWNSIHAVSRALSHSSSTYLCTTRSTLSTTVAFDRCSVIFLPGR